MHINSGADIPLGIYRTKASSFSVIVTYSLAPFRAIFFFTVVELVSISELSSFGALFGYLSCVSILKQIISCDFYWCWRGLWGDESIYHDDKETWEVQTNEHWIMKRLDEMILYAYDLK